MVAQQAHLHVMTTILPNMNKFHRTVSEELRSQSVMDGDHYYAPLSRSIGGQ